MAKNYSKGDSIEYRSHFYRSLRQDMTRMELAFSCSSFLQHSHSCQKLWYCTQSRHVFKTKKGARIIRHFFVIRLFSFVGASTCTNHLHTNLFDRLLPLGSTYRLDRDFYRFFDSIAAYTLRILSTTGSQVKCCRTCFFNTGSGVFESALVNWLAIDSTRYGST